MSTAAPEVLCAGIIVADHVCSPVQALPGPGELVTADRLLLTIGGCAANAAVDLVKMEVRAGIVGRVGDDVFGRVVADMLREQGVDVAAVRVSPGLDASRQTLIVNVVNQEPPVHSQLWGQRRVPGDRHSAGAGRACRILYVGGYLAMPALRAEELALVFAAARRASTSNAGRGGALVREITCRSWHRSSRMWTSSCRTIRKAS